MNVTETSVKNWLDTKSYNSNDESEKIDSTKSVITLSDDQSSFSPQVWDLRWFAILSAPLLFGTIILPLITGPVLRYVWTSYIRLRSYWRLSLVLLAIIWPALYYGLTYGYDDTEVTFFLDMLLLSCATSQPENGGATIKLFKRNIRVQSFNKASIGTHKANKSRLRRKASRCTEIKES
ncbi:uncharacterized protein KY384_000906 [Bacidia gigantensis]|uniref:uncharacterized protein n=1 Tax=Bacidia gigantensis TaxID=2732470 RepID=UPI001D059DEA|nr:uncharacterized protein KY384_000906 [Bacidia gigantensis]KAG8534063.1 hypothetical protein KY384_000906 [Bacidia gigantensis]